MSGFPCVILLAAVICLVVWLVRLVGQTFSAQNRSPPFGRRRAMSLILRWIGWIIFAGLFVLLIHSLPVSTAREAAHRALCCNYLKNIGVAMSNYHNVTGRFPPAYSTDDNGRPLHSWRVLLLPYLEHEDLYQKLKLDEPWNSPHNRAVLETADIPVFYGCPAATDGPAHASYAMIVGPGAISGGPHAVRREDIVDGPGQTLVVVEVAGSGITWYEPRDLESERMSFRINDNNGPGLRSGHTKYNTVVNVLFADGSVHALFDDIDPDILKGLCTIAGGEDVSDAIY